MGAPVEQIDPPKSDPPKDDSKVDSEAGGAVKQACGGVDQLGKDMPDVGGESDKGKDDTKVEGDQGKGKDAESSNDTPPPADPPAGGTPPPATPPAADTPAPADPPAGDTPPPADPPADVNGDSGNGAPPPTQGGGGAGLTRVEIRKQRKAAIVKAAKDGFTAAELAGLRSGAAFSGASAADRAKLKLSAGQIAQLDRADSAISQSGKRVSAAEVNAVLDRKKLPRQSAAAVRALRSSEIRRDARDGSISTAEAKRLKDDYGMSDAAVSKLKRALTANSSGGSRLTTAELNAVLDGKRLPGSRPPARGTAVPIIVVPG